MKQKTEANDIILKSARGILVLGKWLVIFATAMVSLGLLAMPFTYQRILTEVGNAFVSQPKPEIAGLMVLVLLLIIVTLLLTLFAINRLRRIVDSVNEGNPLTRINGTRLRGIGIAALAIQIIKFVASLLVAGLITMLGEPKPGTEFDLSVDASISLSGILLVLLLIILARVFDRGADMQEELEGTV